MRDKKKSSKKDHISNNFDEFYNGPNGPIKYVPNYILPKGYHGSCHLHKEILLFKTIDSLMKHIHDKHDYRNMNIL